MNWRQFLPRPVKERLDISRWDVTTYMQEVARQVPAGDLVLDAGAGDCRYRSLFQGRRYVGVDTAVGKGLRYGELDVLGDLQALPFRDKTFDAALCMNVLEHVRQPERCLGEIHRVIKPQGHLYLMVPLFAREHQAPHDYFRYTSFGIRHLLERTGFAVEYVRPVGGYFRVLANILSRATGYLFPKDRTWPFRALFAPIELLAKPLFSVVIPLVCLGLDPLDRKRTYTMGYQCRGRKVREPECAW
jgi:SAM-dependent methyltransferase